jgi:hypothetical protein
MGSAYVNPRLERPFLSRRTLAGGRREQAAPKAPGLLLMTVGEDYVETDSVCWVCSFRFEAGERVTRLSSLGFEVHARCAEAVLRDEPLPGDEGDLQPPGGHDRPA